MILVLSCNCLCENEDEVSALLQLHLNDVLMASCTKFPKLKCFSSHLAVVFGQSIEARCLVENEDVVGAVLTGDAQTTSEWSTSLLPTKEQLIVEVWQYLSFANCLFHKIYTSLQITSLTIWNKCVMDEWVSSMTFGNNTKPIIFLIEDYPSHFVNNLGEPINKMRGSFPQYTWV